MEKKIYIDGKEQGSIIFRRDGIYTIVEAEISAQEKLMRLYIQGNGKTCGLGIMEPRGKKAVLKRRYSKIELKKLPAEIESAVAVPFDKKPPPLEKTEKIIKPTPKRQEIKKENGKNMWITENGNLFLVTEDGKFLAIPADLRKEVPGIRLKYYKNRQYMLFRY